MSSISVNGVQYNVEIVGSGTPLMCLHGFTGSTKTWTRLAADLRPQFSVILVDMLGHGNSSQPSDPRRYSMNHTIIDLLEILDQIKIDKIDLLGYSLGARTALSFAVRHPERCKNLILESGSPGIFDSSERMKRVEADEKLAKFIDQRGVEFFINYWEGIPLFQSQMKMSSSARASLRSQRLHNSAVGLANSLRGIGTGSQAPVHDFLSATPIPTCIIAGEEDTRYCQIGKDMAQVIPNSHLEVVKNAGHAIHYEHPFKFNTIVKRFLLEQNTTGGR